MKENIGFIGLGIMGMGMARNLLKAGFRLRVWNRTPSKGEILKGEGAAVAETPAALAGSCSALVICVSDTPDVEEVLFGANGIEKGAAPGLLVLDCSTISPARSREFSERLRPKGIHFMDCPISGGSEGAANGTLSIMVGGSEEDFARAHPVFSAMGKTITHVGPVGAGQMVKLVNQILVVGTMLSMSEALLFAQAGGLDLMKTLQAVSPGAAGSWTLSNRGPKVVARDWSPGFMIDLQQKDLRIALQTADELGVPMLASSLVFQLYRTLQQEGLGAEGNHALIKALEKMAGIQVGTVSRENLKKSDKTKGS